VEPDQVAGVHEEFVLDPSWVDRLTAAVATARSSSSSFSPRVQLQPEISMALAERERIERAGWFN
jgi:hypothetical protein